VVGVTVGSLVAGKAGSSSVAGAVVGNLMGTGADGAAGFSIIVGRPVGVAGAATGLPDGAGEGSFLVSDRERTVAAAATTTSATNPSDHSKQPRRAGRFFLRIGVYTARVALLVLSDGGVMLQDAIVENEQALWWCW
jgi:hypothetical protein